MIETIEKDIYLQARTLFYVADYLRQMGNDSIRKLTQKNINRMVKRGDVEGIEKLVKPMPDCVERFFGFEAIEDAKKTKETILKRSKKH